MKHRRRLRRLVPDPELIRRRAAGEPLRELASDYDVAHTTLGRYFERPELAKQVKPAAKTRRRLELVGFGGCCLDLAREAPQHKPRRELVGCNRGAAEAAVAGEQLADRQHAQLLAKPLRRPRAETVAGQRRPRRPGRIQRVVFAVQPPLGSRCAA